MNRLQRELQRLYLLPDGECSNTAVATSAVIDAVDQTRALVLELARPADWPALSAAWHGVQADLDWPAPGIAVSGSDGYQLWFSLAQAVPVAQAQSMLAALQQRYLSGIKPARITSWYHPPLLPAPQGDSGRWSAFVAADLAPLFTNEPWLDTTPSIGGQADLLSQLRSMSPDHVAVVIDRAAASTAPASARPTATATAARTSPERRTGESINGALLGPKQFLVDVMNDSSAELALRVEAAKALLPYFESRPQA